MRNVIYYLTHNSNLFRNHNATVRVKKPEIIRYFWPLLDVVSIQFLTYLSVKDYNKSLFHSAVHSSPGSFPNQHWALNGGLFKAYTGRWKTFKILRTGTCHLMQYDICPCKLEGILNACWLNWVRDRRRYPACAIDKTDNR